MIDLGLNQNKIKEIKYEIKEGKTVIFKLDNSNLEDVEIIEEEIKTKDETIEEENPIEEESKDFNLNEIMRTTKPKQLHDYKPVSCLRNEKGMQETLEAARHKQWKEDVKTKPQKPSQTGNALFPTENIVDLKDKKFMSKPSCATANEITTFLKNQKNADLKEDIKYKDKIEKKLAKDLINSKKIIDDYTAKMSAVEKERFSNRIQDKYFKLDPNDEFSKIKSLNDLNYSSLSSDEPEVRPMSLKEKDDAKLKPIIDAFKETEENETNG